MHYFRLLLLSIGLYLVLIFVRFVSQSSKRQNYRVDYWLFKFLGDSARPAVTRIGLLLGYILLIFLVLVIYEFAMNTRVLW